MRRRVPLLMNTAINAPIGSAGGSPAVAVVPPAVVRAAANRVGVGGEKL
jgi:hypothetical protein